MRARLSIFLMAAATAVQLDRGTDAETWTEDRVLEAAERIRFVPAEGTFVPLIDGAPCDELLRGSDVTRNVSARVGWDRYFHLGNDLSGHGDVDLYTVGVAYKF